MIHNLARANIIQLTPYKSARKYSGKGSIWLNANEYPLPDNYPELKYNNLNRYPNCQPKNLINRYSCYAGVRPEQVLVSRGIDEGIELLMRVFCEPGKDAIMFCPPTYGMYKISADIFGIKYKSIPSTLNWQLNILQISKQLDHIKLIYICNPNNPTGNSIYLGDIKKLLEITLNRALVVIDEAYIDFCPNYSLVNWLSKYEHLVILRTLSKAFALAGLRCGFTLAHPKIIKLILKVIAPYPIPTPVTQIAEYALNNSSLQKIKNKITNIINNREFLLTELQRCPYVIKVFPSVTNYLLVCFNSCDKIFKNLCKQGIIVRDQSKQLGLNNCLRISIGTYKECECLIKTLNVNY